VLVLGGLGGQLRADKYSEHILLLKIISAKPLCLRLLANASVGTRDNAAMLVGMVLFTGLNYLGQRFFAFRSRKTEEN